MSVYSGVFANACRTRLLRPVCSCFLADRLVAKADLDFSDCFATDPELVAHGIGLQPDAFNDFHFNRPSNRE